MRKIIASEWITIDGVFDAAPEYFSEWFLPYDSPARQKWIKNEIESAGTLLLGGNTYTMLAPFWSQQTTDDMGPATKLNSMPKVVVSESVKEPVWQNTEQIIKEDVVAKIEALKNQSGDYILIAGSATLVSSLMEANLVDELHLLVHPVIFGKGKRFFKEKMPVTNMTLVETKDIDKGVVAMSYRVKD